MSIFCTPVSDAFHPACPTNPDQRTSAPISAHFGADPTFKPLSAPILAIFGTEINEHREVFYWILCKNLYICLVGQPTYIQRKCFRLSLSENVAIF